MKTKRWSPGRTVAAVLATGALALLPPPARAQERPTRVERTECRCVDRDGKEIENCTCFRMPDVEGIVARVLPLMGRARMGITVTGSQEEGQGALVEAVMEDGPADEAGLREGDILTRVGGQSLLEPLPDEGEQAFDVDGSLAVQRLLVLARRLEPGESVEVQYLRDGERRTTTLTARELDAWPRMDVAAPFWDREGFEVRMRELGDRVGALHLRRPEDLDVTVWSHGEDEPNLVIGGLPRGQAFFTGPGGRLRAWECPGEGEGARTFLAFSNRCVGGLELLELKPGLAEYFGTTTGVLVADVHEASTLGLEPGDVILDIDGRTVTEPDQARRILLSYEDGEAITLRIMRQQREMSVQGQLRG